MPAEESKPVEPIVADADAKLQNAAVESGSESDNDDPATAGASAGATTEAKKNKKKKKKSKGKKIVDALTGKSSSPDAAAGSSAREGDVKKAIGGLTPQQIQELLSLNPALAQEVASQAGTANPSLQQTADSLSKMSLQEIMTGLAASGKNAKEMGSYKFWQTQPVPKFGEDQAIVEEGPLRIQTVDQVPKERGPLVDGFEWVTMNLKDEAEMKEVYELLNGHYVEDDEAMLRFNYSPSILKW